MQTYSIRQHYFLVHDKPQTHEEVSLLFKDVHTLFKARIQKLANLKQPTTDEEAEIMRTMLESMIQTKKCLLK
jgi:hypothetical protein